MNRLLFLWGLMLPLLSLAQDCQDITKVVDNPNCPAIIGWVCGCDGQTYQNACFAQQSGITQWDLGTCDDGCYNRDTITGGPCPAVFAPVCGCNGITYNNACEATFENGIYNHIPGECPDGCVDSSLIDLVTPCQNIYQPVCGCDSVTYSNSCEAQLKHGIPVFSEGECPLFYCRDYTQIDSSANCIPTATPVCGCDNITYNNACEAEKYNGVRKWTDGPCTTGIRNGLFNEQVKIFPQPAHNSLQLDFGQTIQRVHIEVYSTLGRQLLTEQYQNINIAEIATNKWPTGIYVLKISGDIVHHQTIMVQH